ncbi:MAG: hypothetical protein EBR09_04990 [Proteobacteria bacterium]|nr:hypothetical protein [Pseudomonadota bacterium]
MNRLQTGFSSTSLRLFFCLLSFLFAVSLQGVGLAQEKEEEGDDAAAAEYSVLKQKGCMVAMKTPSKLKVGSTQSFTFGDDKVFKGTVKKATDDKATIAFKATGGKACPDWAGKTPKPAAAEAAEAASEEDASGEEAEKAKPAAAKKDAKKDKKSKKDAKAKKSGKTEGGEEQASQDAAKAKPPESKKEYRIDAGAGYLIMNQVISASNPFIEEAKKEKISSIAGLLYYGGLQASFPISAGNILIGGRYAMYSASKVVELGAGSPSFKYSVKVSELVAKPAFELPTCFGLGFSCAVAGVVGKSNSTEIKIGAADSPPAGKFSYMRFGGGAMLRFKLFEGFSAYADFEGTTSSATLVRGDTEKTFAITPGFIVAAGGINFAL